MEAEVIWFGGIHVFVWFVRGGLVHACAFPMEEKALARSMRCLHNAGLFAVLFSCFVFVNSWKHFTYFCIDSGKAFEHGRKTGGNLGYFVQYSASFRHVTHPNRGVIRQSLETLREESRAPFCRFYCRRHGCSFCQFHKFCFHVLFSVFGLMP